MPSLTLAGKPLVQRNMLETCQSPIMPLRNRPALANRSLFLPKGSSAMKLAFTECRVSKSETLRRVIEAAALAEDVDTSADAVTALRELQDRLALTPEKAEAWLRRVRELRGHEGP